MSLLKRSRHNCFCAFCRSPRWIVRRKHIGFSHLFTSGFGAIATMLLLFRGFDPRVSMFFAIYAAFAEIFVQIRWRMGIVCKTCGFDPVMYLKEPEKAVAKVKNRLDERRNDPRAILARPLNLPTIGSGRALELREFEDNRQKKKTGAVLSKSI